MKMLHQQAWRISVLLSDVYDRIARIASLTFEQFFDGLPRGSIVGRID